MTTTTARQDFQNYLRQALDTHHPRWEVGLRGKEQRTSRQQFTTVACETLHDWVNGVKSQCPQQKSFQAFLDEAEFPEETTNTVWTFYLNLKRERKRGNERQDASGQVTNGRGASALLTRIRETKNTVDNDTILLDTLMPGKEYMHEFESQGETRHIKKWEAETLEDGILNVNHQVRKYVENTLERVLEDIATNPKLAGFSAGELADTVWRALSDVVTKDVSREALVDAMSFYRKNR